MLAPFLESVGSSGDHSLHPYQASTRWNEVVWGRGVGVLLPSSLHVNQDQWGTELPTSPSTDKVEWSGERWSQLVLCLLPSLLWVSSLGPIRKQNFYPTLLQWENANWSHTVLQQMILKSSWNKWTPHLLSYMELSRSSPLSSLK